MQKLLCALAMTLTALYPAAAELPTGSDPLLQCHKLHSDGVGLVVRAGASSKSRKLGTLEAGQKVKLDGEVLPDTGAVYPIIKTDSDGGYWIKIKGPKVGYVLFASKDDEEFRYLIPCE
ncbi:MAG TPA: SH3 domain-containing protein [Chthoniobacterales bacterium]